MPSALETHQVLGVLTNQAVSTGLDLLDRTSGDPVARRLQLLDAVPALISYYTDGSSALAADFYDDERAAAHAKQAFTAAPVVLDRTVKIRRAIAWAAQPLFDGEGDTSGRLAEILQYETARPFRDTILTNRSKDSQAVGWTRIASGKACSFCRMLAANGAVYSERGVRFAAHTHCGCTAAPAFVGGKRGPSASVIQYRASSSNRSAKQRADLRDYLATYFPETSPT